MSAGVGARVSISAGRSRSDLARTTGEPREQRALARSPDGFLRACLASNPNLVPDIQHELASGSGTPVLLQLAGNPNLVPDLQHELADHSDWAVRADLAGNPNLLPELQHVLVRDPDSLVRTDLGLNPSLLPELCEELLGDANNVVQRCVLENPNLTLRPQLAVEFLELSQRGQEYLERELEGCDPNVRAALAPTWAGTLEELLVALRVLA